MLKKIIATSLVATALLFSGCGDAEGESRLAAQNAIDSGSPDQAIALLESTPISDMNSTQSEAFLATLSVSTKKTLASAYMDKAGVSLLDMVGTMDSASNTGSGDSFASLAQSLSGDDINVTTQKIKDIDSAIAYYSSITDAPASAPSRAISRAVDPDLAEDIKLYLGIAYMAKATMLIGYLGDVASLESGVQDLVMQNTVEAMKCIYGNDCPVDTVFTDETNGVVGYENFTFIYFPTGDFYRLASYGTRADTANDSLLVADYNRYHPISSSDLPFGNDYKLEIQLLDALNGAFDIILDTAPEDVQNDIIEYRAKIDDPNVNTVENPTGVLTIEEIRNYIDSNQ